ncbi:MAG: hypothetical protein HQM12_14135, partial [SAR324 cluster bacterium]|nr:hypothetical protein [SAR324 cluster bacterium]
YLTDLINGVDDAATVAELINHLDLQGNPSGCDKLRITLETVAIRVKMISIMIFIFMVSPIDFENDQSKSC